MSPKRLWEHVNNERGEKIPQSQFYALKREAYPDVKTIKDLEIIEPCDDETEDNVTAAEVQQIGLRILKRDLLDYENGEKQIATATVGQIVGMLNKMDNTSDNAVPMEDVIDNTKAVEIVLKGSKYDK